MKQLVQKLGANQYRKFPRAYDLGIIGRYLAVLHSSPVPIKDIEERKLESNLALGKVSRETGEEIRQWKR